MKLVVSKNHLGGQILYRSPKPSQKRHHNPEFLGCPIFLKFFFSNFFVKFCKNVCCACDGSGCVIRRRNPIGNNYKRRRWTRRNSREWIAKVLPRMIRPCPKKKIIVSFFVRTCICAFLESSKHTFCFNILKSNKRK